MNSTYKNKREKGLCVVCGKPSGGKFRCSKCAKQKNLNAKHLRKLREKNGVCTECGGNRDDLRYKLCSSCREKHRLRDKKNSTKKKQYKKEKITTDFLICIIEDTAKDLNTTIPKNLISNLQIKLDLLGLGPNNM